MAVIPEAAVSYGPQLSPDAVGGGGGTPTPESREQLPLYGKNAVILGTSRGIGAATAVALAEFGADIVGTHVNPAKAEEQLATAQSVNELGGSFRSLIADNTVAEDQEAIVQAAIEDTTSPRGVDILILNAAGGMEPGKPSGWAETINYTSNLQIVDQFMPYMAEGSSIIFPTSVWAHDYGNVMQNVGYAPVAYSKYMFEQAMRERQPELTERGIKLGVVVGNVIEGTATHKLFERLAKQDMERIRELSGGQFADTVDMAHATRELVTSDFGFGETVYVGSPNVEPINFPSHELDREELSKILPMYSPGRLLVDTFQRTGVGEGRGTYTVRKRDTEGHFTGPFKNIKIFPGVNKLEMMAQIFGLSVMASEGRSKVIGFFKGGGNFEFDYPLEEGITAEVYARMNHRTREGAIGDVEVRVGELVISRIHDLEIGIAPENLGSRALRSGLNAVRRAAQE